LCYEQHNHKPLPPNEAPGGAHEPLSVDRFTVGDGFAKDTLLHLRAHAVSPAGVAGPTTAVISITVGAGIADIPAVFDDDAVTVTTLLGGARISFATGTDANTTQVQLFRSTSAVLDRETDAVGEPLSVTPLQSYALEVGDTSRVDLIHGGGMNDAGDWDLDAGWAVAGGLATHTPGTADAISQSLAAVAGKFYRLGFTVSGRTAGTVTPRLTGGSDRPGTGVSADGIHADEIQAVTGNDTFEFLASSDFDGSLDLVAAH